MGLCAVKFPNNPHGSKSLVNELIGFQVAGVLGLECPECGVVQIEPEVLPKGRLELLDADGAPCVFGPGLAFYSRWLQPADHPTVSDIAGLTVDNPTFLAGMVLLDLLLGNWDRKPSNPNMLLHRQRRHRLVLIDLGMAFGGGVWELGNLQNTDLWPPHEAFPYASDIEALLVRIKTTDFSGYLAKLVELTRAKLEEIVAKVPSEWGITEAERLALVNYLYTKAQALPTYLEQRLARQEWWK